ncbi:MAG: cysteine dioxygenase family protein [Planctomycetes bacterium]|nr:cysteine dioxygenase family protein [Planctomycetota bacterium]
MSAPITKLAEQLLACFQADEQGRGAVRALESYARAHEDWRTFARFDPALYTRNLVARNEHFEMLVLCWSAGQESPIHDHAGQHCFMAVLEGRIEELQYEVPAGSDGGALRCTGARVYERGQVAYIHDRIALHRVRPHGGHPAVSLHLYARPIDVCRVFDEASGAVLSRQLIYHSATG